MDQSNFFSQNKYSTLQRTNDYHSFYGKCITSRDGWHKSGEINKLPLKKWNAKSSSSKKVAVLSTKMLSKIIRYKASINGGLRDTFATNTVSLEKMDDCNCSLKKKTSHLQV